MNLIITSEKMLVEGFSKKKYDNGEIYRFLKGNTWVLDTSAPNNLGDYQNNPNYPFSFSL